MVTKNKSESLDEKITQDSLKNCQNWELITELGFFNLYKDTQNSLFWLECGAVFGPYKTFEESCLASRE